MVHEERLLIGDLSLHEVEDEIEFDVAHVFFELNNTDGDLGIDYTFPGATTLDPGEYAVVSPEKLLPIWSRGWRSPRRIK